MKPESTSAAPASLPVRVQRFYEDLSVERAPVLDRLGELFTDDIEFLDPFRHTRGMIEFRVLFERMLRQYKSVRFTSFSRVGSEEAFTLTYDMGLRMFVGPEFVTPMASVCVGRDGKVARLVDYYDFASGLVSPIESVARAYRRVTRALFL